MLLFNRCIVVSLFWWFYPHLRQGNTPGGHWFVRRNFFPVWGRCNFLILLLSADLTAVLPQLSQVVAAHLTLHMALESFYLSCLYFRICSFTTVTIKGGRQPFGLLAPVSVGRSAAGNGCSLLLLLIIVRISVCYVLVSCVLCTVVSTVWGGNAPGTQFSFGFCICRGLQFFLGFWSNWSVNIATKIRHWRIRPVFHFSNHYHFTCGCLGLNWYNFYVFSWRI